MAEPSNIGALGNLSRGDFDKLSLGVQGQNNAKDVFGYSLTPSTVVSTGLGLVSGLGTPMAIGSQIGNYQAEQAANKLLGNPTNFMNNIKQPGNKASAVQKVRGMISDIDKDGIISNYEMNKFGQNIQGLDLAPMYSGGDETNMVKGYGGKTMPSGATANPFNSREAQLRSEAGYEPYTQAYRTANNMQDALKSPSQYAGDAINQTNIKNYDPSKGQYDKNYAKAVTKQSQEEAGSSEAGSTFICTTLYEIGDMKKSIYKYDSMYGRKVNSAIYRGYALWGKPLAKQIKKKGLVYKLIKPIALSWANQMAYDLTKGKTGKNSLAMKITKTIGEGACYVLGQIFKRRTLWLKST